MRILLRLIVCMCVWASNWHIFITFPLKKLYSTWKLILIRVSLWHIQMMLQLFILRVILYGVAFAFFSILGSTHAFRLVILTIYQILQYLSKSKLSFQMNLFYLSINVSIWHSPNVNSTVVRGWKEDLDLESFLLWQGNGQREFD